jgi:protein gp37
MSQTTKIEWTDVSWNPVHGCSRVSTGCKHCYAETLSLRYGQTKAPWSARNAEQNVMLKPHKLREPLSKAGPWKNPCRVFVNSMSDLFHEQIPDDYIGDVFDVMRAAERHTFQVLTKRPERMRDFVRAYYDYDESDPPGTRIAPWGNVWLGVSIENRKWVGRADVLREVPAAVRFISAEPLLGPLLPHIAEDEDNVYAYWPDDGAPCVPYDGLSLFEIDWLIVGGESGSGHRPFDPEWARALRDACECTDTAFFVKQLGGSRPGTALEDLPEDLRIREFPR